jgi:hypothetical protein
MPKLPRLRKARGQAPSGGQDVSDLIEMMTRVNGRLQDRNEMLSRLPLDPEWQLSEFGPGFPIPSEPLDLPNAQGFVSPRIYQYPVQWNIPGRHDRLHVPWDVLKHASEQPIFRACIEIRKQRISTLDWCFRVSPSYAAKAARQAGKTEYEVQEDLRKQFQAEIDRLTAWWDIPDRRNGIEFADWMSQVQEEQLVWDALAVYPQKTFGGGLLNLTVIDGSTIKPLLDEQGGRPMPPHPAYQQLLYGFPRGDFTADTVDIDGNLVIPGAFSSSQLIYRRRVVRTRTPYGFSPTEQALLDGTLWDRRFRWMLAEYTEGAQPVQWLVNKGDSGWDARQLLAYEKAMNDRLAGKTGERYRNPLLPEGIEPVRNEGQSDRYKPDYDLFLIKLQAMHFGVTMPELGFSEPGGLGSSGYHEGQEDIQFRKDLTTVRWLNTFVTSISRTHLGMPAALEFAFLGLDEEDESTADAIDDMRVHGARMTLNEARVKVGQPPYDFPEGDMPMLMTPRGVVFISGAATAAPPGVLVEPAELKTGPGEPGDESGDDGDYEQGGPDEPPKAKVQGSPAPARPVKRSPSAAAMAKELAQFATWIEKGKGPYDFEFLVLDEYEADLLKAAAGGGNPKDSSPAGFTPTSSSPYTRPSSQ